MNDMPSPPIPLPPPSTARQRDQFRAAYSVLEQAIVEHAFPGAAFGVLAEGKILALDAVGAFTYSPGAPAVTPSSIFDLASVTKVIATTSMAMLLYQRKQFALDQPLADILPGFGNSATRSLVTLRLLLAHASGLPGYVRLYEQAHTREELLQACLSLPLEAAPGSCSEYSDPGFILLGEALTTIAGESIDSFCIREVFTPLKMSSTRFQPGSNWRSAILPTEEDLTFRKRIIQGEVQDENCFVLGGIAGHAGLFSNALDPLLYAQELLQEPRTHGSGQTPCGLFASETLELFTARAGLPPGSSRGLGWDTPSKPSSSGKFFSRHSAGHLGFAGTSLWIDFERKISVVLLTNRTWPRRESQAIRSVRPAFHDAVMVNLG